MKLNTDGTPEFFWNAKFYPICGHWFWDNEYGANSFCQKIGYKSGTIEETEKIYAEDAIRIGKCHAGEQLELCSGGCNDKGIGNGCAECAAGESVGFTIKCDGYSQEHSITCRGNKNKPVRLSEPRHINNIIVYLCYFFKMYIYRTCEKTYNIVKCCGSRHGKKSHRSEDQK